jgi:hypothetical protein
MPLLFGLALLAGCGKGYDQEIILQLFRPRAAAADKVRVEASQSGGILKELDLPNPFASCSTNQVRIIPRQIEGKYPPVHVVVRSGVLRAEADVVVPAQNPITLVLGTGLDLVPSGPCTPGQPKPPDDGSLLKKALAEPCTLNQQCEGNLCLKRIESNPIIEFPDGYCSQDCEATKTCPGGENCKRFDNALGALIGYYCLKTCTDPPGCSNPKLRCTPGGVCLP